MANKYLPEPEVDWTKAPVATTAKAGVVKKAANVAEPVGEAPTAEEFTALLDALIDAGIMSEKAE